MATTKKTAKPAIASHQSLEVPFASIHADHSWNSRGAIDLSDGNPEYTSIKELAISIAKRGQDTEIIVRPRKGAKNSYQTVAGFRRYAAFSLLDDPKWENGEYYDPSRLVRVDCRDLDDKEAREVNLRENLSREDIDPCDKIVGVRNYLAEFTKAGAEAPTTTVLGQNLGISQKSASRYTSLLSKLRSEIVDKWSAARLRPSREAVEKIAELDKEKQVEAFDALIKGGGSGGGDANGGSNRWLPAAKSAAFAAGAALATLEDAGVIRVTGPAIAALKEEHVRLLVDYKESAKEGENSKKGATKEQNEEVRQSLIDGYRNRGEMLKAQAKSAN